LGRFSGVDNSGIPVVVKLDALEKKLLATKFSKDTSP
jgi:hypothetical protein